MNNYQFCAQWALRESAGLDARVLDFGCGSGVVVDILRRNDIEAFGCDPYSSSMHRGPDPGGSLNQSGFISVMEQGKVPFGNQYFDLVINNQVMEHVEDLNLALGEIRRVLKPGGKVLSLFPDKSVWREGHCGVPFLHWFPKNSGAVRTLYAALWRLIGFGHHKRYKGILTWSRDFGVYLDSWTHYRSRHEIDTAYRQFFNDIHHIENHWLSTRLGSKSYLLSWLPSAALRFLVRKWCGLVFVAQKTSTTHRLCGPAEREDRETHRPDPLQTTQRKHKNS